MTKDIVKFVSTYRLLWLSYDTKHAHGPTLDHGISGSPKYDAYYYHFLLMPAEKLDWLIPRRFSILSKLILERGLKTTTSNISILLVCSSRTNAGLLYVVKRCYVKSISECWAVSLVVPDWQGSNAVTLGGPCVCVNGQLDRVSSSVFILWRLTVKKMVMDRFFAKVKYCMGYVIQRAIDKCFWL